MTARGNLFIKYLHDKKGNLLEDPYYHDLKSITVHNNPTREHGLIYEFEDGRSVFIQLSHDRVTILEKGNCVDHFMASEEMDEQ